MSNRGNVSADTVGVLLARLDPSAPARLLALHHPDRRGRCVTCTLPQAGPAFWPCTLHAVAVAAVNEVATPPPQAVPLHSRRHPDSRPGTTA